MQGHDHSFCAVEMGGDCYPFGELKQNVGGDELVLVHKKLIYDSQRELQILKKMSIFLSSLENEYLISLHHFQPTPDHKFHLYYEYAPLTLEKWILDLGDDVLEQLEFQMLNLASYLSQTGIKFKFEWGNLGLSKEIKIKYFLNQFSIDTQNKLANFNQAQQDIAKYFHDFRQHNQDHSTTTIIDRKSTDSSNYFGSSITTRQSWDVKSSKSSNSGGVAMNKISLKQKIEKSKKKSLQILQKLKSMKSNQ